MRPGPTRRVATLMAFALLAGACAGSDDAPDAADVDTAAVPTASASVAALPASPEEALDAFVQGWQTQDWAELSRLVAPESADPSGTYADFYDELQVVSTAIEAGQIQQDAGTAVVDLDVTIDLDQLGPWAYPTTATLVMHDGHWLVDWQPATLYPALRDGRTVERLRIWPDRGELLAWDGTPLRTDLPVVSIGIEPQRIEDRDVLLPALSELTGVPEADIAAALDAPGVQPDWFVPVTKIRAEAFVPLESEVMALEGVVVQEGTDRLGPTEGYASQLLGATGPITAEQLEAWGAPYDATSTVGRSGLELSYERELAGSPTGEVRLVEADGQLLSVVHRFPGDAPRDVTTTIDVQAQAAAEAALDPVTEPAALVALDAATGEVRALVSRPTDEFGRANAGAYPPGSTFKTITAAAYLAAGATPATTVSCPAQAVVEGLPFSNAGGLSLGSVSLQGAYAASCNTAFVNISTLVDATALRDVASLFGFGAEYSIGLTTAGGSLPPPIDDAEHAASSIGQGRVTASPLHMASVAAAVSDGTWRQPTLVIDPAVETTVSSSELTPSVVDSLRALMRSVVTNGTGSAAARAGGDIAGKTGSAEFGDDDPPETHAWFIGYRDDLAFAVLVEGGGAGGQVAAPIAADFLLGLDAQRAAS